MGTKIIGEKIYNPVTRKYYEIRQRTTEYGKAGQIRGLWSSSKKGGDTNGKKKEKMGKDWCSP